MKFSLKTKVDFKKGFKDLEKFKKHLSKLNDENTAVGYTTDQLHLQDGREEAIDMAYLATILHEGTQDGRIPPRPFLRQTLQQLTSGNKFRFLRKPFINYLESINNKQYSVDQLLLDLGDIIRKEVQKNFGINNTIDLESNAPSTIRKKGSDDPLVESGVLRDSLKVKTSRGGES